MRCQIDAISDCATVNDIKVTLKNLPKDLNETYDRILTKIVGKGEATAARAEKILTWLMGALMPLRISELEEALMIELDSAELSTSSRLIDPSEILITCGSLVEAFPDPNGDNLQVVRLSHYTVQVDTDCSGLLYPTELLYLGSP